MVLSPYHRLGRSTESNFHEYLPKTKSPSSSSHSSPPPSFSSSSFPSTVSHNQDSRPLIAATAKGTIATEATTTIVGAASSSTEDCHEYHENERIKKNQSQRKTHNVKPPLHPSQNKTDRNINIKKKKKSKKKKLDENRISTTLDDSNRSPTCVDGRNVIFQTKTEKEEEVEIEKENYRLENSPQKLSLTTLRSNQQTKKKLHSLPLGDKK